VPNLPVDREVNLFRGDEALKIEKCMTKAVLFLRSGIPIKEAAKIFCEKKFGALPILDNEDKLIGIVSITDIFKVCLPDFVSLVDIDFIKSYGALELSIEDIKRLENLVVDDIMTKDVIVVDEDCVLVRAMSLMKKHGFRHLPVLREGELVGIVSNIDICRCFLEIWEGKDFGEV
jgi:CBS domain-containing protein